MKQSNRRRPLLALGLIFALWSCASAAAKNMSPSALSATVLTGGQQCLPAPDAWTATWIESQEALQRFMSRCHAQRWGGPPMTLPDVDFNQHRILALEMGQQPSAGYGFDANGVVAMKQGRSAIVRIAWHRPPPGVMTAQVLTSPWMLIRLPAGPVDSIRVVDQNDQPLTRLTVTSP